MCIAFSYVGASQAGRQAQPCPLQTAALPVAHLYTYTYTYVHMYVYVCTFKYIHMYIHAHICVYISLYTRLDCFGSRRLLACFLRRLLSRFLHRRLLPRFQSTFACSLPATHCNTLASCRAHPMASPISCLVSRYQISCLVSRYQHGLPPCRAAGRAPRSTASSLCRPII